MLILSLIYWVLSTVACWCCSIVFLYYVLNHVRQCLVDNIFLTFFKFFTVQIEIMRTETRRQIYKT